MDKLYKQVTEKILCTVLIWLFALPARAEIILDCSVDAYKLEKSLFGLKQKVSTKYVGIDSNWKTFCKNGEVTFEGSTVVCTETFKSYLRVNSEQIVAKVKRFECPKDAELPRAPQLWLHEDDYYSKKAPANSVADRVLIVRDDNYKFIDPNEHFKEQKCTYFGELINVPAIQKKYDAGKWTTAVFPRSYPFIGLIHRDQYTNGMTVPDTDYLYERFVFGHLDENYTKKSGSIHKTYIDFGLGEYNYVGWQIDPDTGERISKQDTKYNRRCKKIED